MDQNEYIAGLAGKATGLGAFRANVIKVSAVDTDRAFREMCEKNTCGNYGRNWCCPPDVGDIDELVAELDSYEYILVYQTVGELEDSFDFEGMQEVSAKHKELMGSVRKLCDAEPLARKLYLGAGGCTLCEKCARITDEPCRHPDIATASLESYGINVSKLAAAAGMKYINGQNTVTFFGAVVFDLPEELSAAGGKD